MKIRTGEFIYTNDVQHLLQGATEVNELKWLLLQSLINGSSALPSAHPKIPLTSMHGCSLVNKHYYSDMGPCLGTTKAEKRDTAIEKIDPCFLSLQWDSFMVCLKQVPRGRP